MKLIIKRNKLFSENPGIRLELHSSEFSVLRTLENLGWPKIWIDWIKFVNPCIRVILDSPETNAFPLFAWPGFEESRFENPESFESYLSESNFAPLFSTNPEDPLNSPMTLWSDRSGYLYIQETPGKFTYIGSSLPSWYLPQFPTLFGPTWESDPRLRILWKAIKNLE